MRNTRVMTAAALCASGLLLAAACSSGGQNFAGPSVPGVPGSSGGPDGTASGAGTLEIRMTDSPFTEATAVLVTFSEVSVHRTEGDGWQAVPFGGGASERTCDLKLLQGPVDLLGIGTLPAGHYTQIRLTVDEARIFFDNPSGGVACAPTIAAPGGASAEVEIPSGVVKLNRQFTIENGGSTTITLDFDGDGSIKKIGGGSGNGGNGRGRGQNAGDDDDEEENPEDGRYRMTPVIGVVSVQ